MHSPFLRIPKFQHHLHTASREEGGQPGVKGASDAVVVELVEEFPMGHSVKRLAEVKDSDVNLFPRVEGG